MTEVPYVYSASFIRAVDGDTADFSVSLGFHMTAVLRLRFLGVNTPEKGKPGAAEATQFTHSELSHAEEIRIKTQKSDSFGRWLAKVSYRRPGETDFRVLNDQLLEKGLAVPFRG